MESKGCINRRREKEIVALIIAKEAKAITILRTL
jgi:hypothetical protein